MISNKTSVATQPSDCWPELMTEVEVIRYLRIPEVSDTPNHHYVIRHLKRMRDLPCIHISRKPLYPLQRVREWVLQQR